MKETMKYFAKRFAGVSAMLFTILGLGGVTLVGVGSILVTIDKAVQWGTLSAPVGVFLGVLTLSISVGLVVAIGMTLDRTPPTKIQKRKPRKRSKK